jgi:hypothetical protein
MNKIEEATNFTIQFKAGYNKDAVINITCSNESIYEDGGIIVGYGGIMHYAGSMEIISGEVILSEGSGYPSVEMHEILHALGFGHSPDEESIMYPYTNQVKEIDKEIISCILHTYGNESFGNCEGVEKIKTT